MMIKSEENLFAHDFRKFVFIFSHIVFLINRILLYLISTLINSTILLILIVVRILQKPFEEKFRNGKDAHNLTHFILREMKK